jgi:prepilin-type N-terminal cleavage/methylation domain-containing protein
VSANRRTGTTLLEVLVALAILGTSGAAAASLAGDAVRTIRTVRRSELEIRRANAFMNAVSLWPAEDLNRRLGVRRQGPWRLHIDRRSDSLYEVTLSDSTSGRILLGTTLYRRAGVSERVDDAH